MIGKPPSEASLIEQQAALIDEQAKLIAHLEAVVFLLKNGPKKQGPGRPRKRSAKFNGGIIEHVAKTKALLGGRSSGRSTMTS